MKYQTHGYQCPQAETLAEPMIPYSFILQTNVNLFYHKKLLLWRSCWASRAPERDIFSTNRIRAKCRCQIAFSFYNPHTMWFFFSVFCLFVSEKCKIWRHFLQKGRLRLWHKEMPDLKSSLLYHQVIMTVNRTVKLNLYFFNMSHTPFLNLSFGNLPYLRQIPKKTKQKQKKTKPPNKNNITKHNLKLRQVLLGRFQPRLK